MTLDADPQSTEPDTTRATADDLRAALLARAGPSEAEGETRSSRWPLRCLRRLARHWPLQLAERARANAIRRREDAAAAALGLSPTDDLAELIAKVAAIGLDVTSIDAADDGYRAAVVDRRLGTPDTPVVAAARTPMEAVCRATAQLVLRATAGAGPES
jgi:hypothetical protein